MGFTIVFDILFESPRAVDNFGIMSETEVLPSLSPSNRVYTLGQ